MVGEAQTQRKNHVKLSPINGLNMSRRNPGEEGEK
jgi:hypothetical protein